MIADDESYGTPQTSAAVAASTKATGPDLVQRRSQPTPLSPQFASDDPTFAAPQPDLPALTAAPPDGNDGQDPAHQRPADAGANAGQNHADPSAPAEHRLDNLVAVVAHRAR